LDSVQTVTIDLLLAVNYMLDVAIKAY